MNRDMNAPIDILEVLGMDGHPSVIFFFNDNPSVRVVDSYKVSKRKDIRAELERIHDMPAYKELQESGYSRTFESEYREWRAHNILHKFGIYPNRTGSVDLDQNESKFRRIGYAILGLF